MAKQHEGKTKENPSVAAIITRNDSLISFGVHHGAGLPHAEVMAIKAIKNKNLLIGACIYITMEPCTHHGRTPPCTTAIINAGIKRVVYGTHDANPLVRQTANKILEKNGVSCCCIHTPCIYDFYKYYRNWQSECMSQLVLKIALDQTDIYCHLSGKPLSITGDVANYWTHHQRYKAHALLTTAATINNDNPRFNLRYFHTACEKPLIILSRSANIEIHAAALKFSRRVILVHSQTANKKQLNILQQHNIQTKMIHFNLNTAQFWLTLRQYLGTLGYHTVWCEIGGIALEQALLSGQVATLHRIVSQKKFSTGRKLALNLNQSLTYRSVTNKLLHKDTLFTYTRPKLKSDC